MSGDMVRVPREALKNVVEFHTEQDRLTGNITCLSCYVTLFDPRTTGNIHQDHKPDCDILALQAALSVTEEPA